MTRDVGTFSVFPVPGNRTRHRQSLEEDWVKLSDIIPRKAVVEELNATEKEAAIRELVELIREHHDVKTKTVDVMGLLMGREARGSTGIGDGVAIPHEAIDGLKDFVGAFGRCSSGIEFRAIDGEPVHLIFVILHPKERIDDKLKLLKKIASAMKSSSSIHFGKFLKNAKGVREIHEIFQEIDEKFPG